MISDNEILEYFDQVLTMEKDQAEEYQNLVAELTDDSLRRRFDHLLTQEREHINTVTELRQRFLDESNNA